MTKTVILTIPLTCDGEWPDDDTILGIVTQNLPGVYLSEDYDRSDKWALICDDFKCEIKK